MALYSLRVRRTLTTLSSFINHHRSLPAISASSSSYSSPLLQSLIYSPSPSPTLPVQSRLFKTSSISLSSAISYNNSDDGDDDNISSHTIFFEGCDYNHWLFIMDFPKSLKLTPEQMVETYVQTCAKGLNISVEEAKNRMYACSTTTYTGFQAVMTEEESEKFRGLPGVLFVLPDSYIDQTSQEYGGDKYINGTIIPRPPPFNYGSIWGRPKFLRSGAKELRTCGADRDGARRTKAFSTEEDIAICRAWLCITQDPVIGTSQKDTVYWRRIFENYNENKPTMVGRVRTLCSVRNRWGKIQHACNKYRECIADAEGQHATSGTTIQNKLLEAKIIYQEDMGKHFNFDNCWPILETSQKWWLDNAEGNLNPESPTASPNLSASISLGSSQDPIDDSVNSPRSKKPSGRKAEKEAQRKNKVGENSDSRFCDTQEARTTKIQLEARKVIVMEEWNQRALRKEQDEIMRVDTSNMDDPQMIAYWKMRKAEVFSQLMDRSSSSQYYVPDPPST